ncbi:hypothetical protein BCR43DRAFT_377805 [Syncephalastrum racemosum]|uniref:Uncharacterized protein n=1 Tax=Syncephalastrum racemosum TaxID=13706 RepID=A0A1X2H4Y2_SYNRA|nr:hypothetical protein BCR43DRAFT_377805 [Syncephalastrum racemosum]
MYKFVRAMCVWHRNHAFRETIRRPGNSHVICRARNELQAQKNELTRLRQDAFGLQCLVEESEATVHQLASQMGRLQRQKVLAVETGQLVKAAQAAENLNKVEQRYAQAETSRSEHKETLDKKLELLRDQKKRLEQAETDHAESVHQATQDLILGLRKAERALSDVQESALLQDLIDLEKEHMRAQIESLQRHLVKEPAVNLLSLDDDTTTDNSTQHHQGD